VETLAQLNTGPAAGVKTTSYESERATSADSSTKYGVLSTRYRGLVPHAIGWRAMGLVPHFRSLSRMTCHALCDLP
jgi:hypothetical protein